MTYLQCLWEHIEKQKLKCLYAAFCLIRKPSDLDHFLKYICEIKALIYIAQSFMQSEGEKMLPDYVLPGSKFSYC